MIDSEVIEIDGRVYSGIGGVGINPSAGEGAHDIRGDRQVRFPEFWGDYWGLNLCRPIITINFT